MAPTISELIEKHRPNLSGYEELYKYFHANPELSNQEHETAASIAKHLKEKISTDWDVRTGIGGTGIAALLFNGQGPTILLRADFDALPVQERTGLEYASKKRMVDADGIEKPVMGPVATGVGEVYQYYLSSDTLDLTELRTLHDWVVRPRLRFDLPGQGPHPPQRRARTHREEDPGGRDRHRR